MYRSSNSAVKLSLDNASFDVDFGQLFEISDSGIEVYRGAYLVEPDFMEQTLYTKDKKMLNDVTVKAIEIQRVSNTSGGRTVYIGGLING